MKRFTETEKYRDPWYRKLSPAAKLAYEFMCADCDCVGVWQADFELGRFSIGMDIDWDAVIEEFGNRVRILKNGKIWITRFVEFQYGQLTPNCKPHVKYLDTLKKHGIDLADCYRTWPGSAQDEVTHERESEPELNLRGPRQQSRESIIRALAEVQGTDLGRVTAKGKERLSKSADEIIAAEPGVSPERIREAAKAWKRKGYSAPATANAIATHWAELTTAPLGAGVQERIAKLDAQLSEMSQPAGEPGKFMPRADLTGPQRREYDRLLDELVTLKRQKTG